MTRKDTAMSRARATNAQKLLSTVRTSAKPQNGRCIPVRWNARQLLNRGNPAMVPGARTSNKSNLPPECESNAAAAISGASYGPASAQRSKRQKAIGHEPVQRHPDGALKQSAWSSQKPYRSDYSRQCAPPALIAFMRNQSAAGTAPVTRQSSSASDPEVPL
jgi:hypothetical protein